VNSSSIVARAEVGIADVIRCVAKNAAFFEPYYGTARRR